MRSIMSKVWRGFIGFNVAVVLSIGLGWGFDVPWYWTLPSAFVSFVGITLLMKVRTQKKIAQQNKLSRQEYVAIQKSLQEAKQKLSTLQRNRFKAKSVKLFKSVNHTYYHAKRIYEVVSKEPKRFYKANDFFYRYLDSASEIVERYMFLASQPLRDAEYMEALTRTETMLKEMEQCLEQELRKVVSGDLEDLEIEVEVLQQSIKRTSSTHK